MDNAVKMFKIKSIKIRSFTTCICVLWQFLVPDIKIYTTDQLVDSSMVNTELQGTYTGHLHQKEIT